MPTAAQIATPLCIACLRLTDTVLCLDGAAEWHAAAMEVWGIPQGQAEAIIRRDPAAGAGGTWVSHYRVCGGCAGKAGMTPALYAAGTTVPAYAPPVPE